MPTRKAQTKLEYALSYGVAILIFFGAVLIPLLLSWWAYNILVFYLPSMIGVVVNPLAILVAAVVGEIRSVVLRPSYGDSLLATPREIKKIISGEKKDLEAPPHLFLPYLKLFISLSWYLCIFIASVLVFILSKAYILALFIGYTHAETIVAGAEVGLLVGIVLRVLIILLRLLSRRAIIDRDKNTLMNYFYSLIEYAIMGIILVALG